MGQIEDERIRSESLAWIMLILVCGGLFQWDECTKDANDTKAKQQYVVPPIKEAKIKANPTIQGEQVRVTSKSKDELQSAMALLRGGDFKVDLQFKNFR